MNRWYVVTTVLALSVSPIRADEPIVYPKGPAPVFFSAQVSGKDSDQVTFAKPVFKTVYLEQDGKKISKQVSEFIPVTTVKLDGKLVRAFGADGKPLESGDVAKRLAKLAPVVVFYTDPPDAYYLQILKQGTVVFVVPQDKFGPLPSPTPPK